jgi:antitoxin component of MazEF toxin-antitoxin module
LTLVLTVFYDRDRGNERMAIIKKLARLGNSSAVILDKAVLRLVDLEPDSDVRITVEGDAICIRRHRPASATRPRTRRGLPAHRRAPNEEASTR